MKWIDKYNLAKTYYEHYNNLEVPQSFKTTNGYEYDENGFALGMWIARQRQTYKGKGTCKLTDEQIKLLKEINIRFETINNEEEWLSKYKLAKVYYEHYKNLEVPRIFKTTNGYEYDENGVTLGIWIARQRQTYKGLGNCKLTEKQIQLLKEINIRFETRNNQEEWLSKYNLAKTYYEYYNNLEVPQDFKTTNGYEYDENGFALGIWIARQRQTYKGLGDCKLTDNKIQLLEKIEMKWYHGKTDCKYQSQEIKETNKISKQIEILNRVRSFLNTYDEKTLPTKEEINREMVKTLNYKINK